MMEAEVWTSQGWIVFPLSEARDVAQGLWLTSNAQEPLASRRVTIDLLSPLLPFQAPVTRVTHPATSHR